MLQANDFASLPFYLYSLHRLPAAFTEAWGVAEDLEKEEKGYKGLSSSSCSHHSLANTTEPSAQSLLYSRKSRISCRCIFESNTRKIADYPAYLL